VLLVSSTQELLWDNRHDEKRTYAWSTCFKQSTFRNRASNAWLPLRKWSRLAIGWFSRWNMDDVTLVNITTRDSLVFHRFDLSLFVFLLGIIKTVAQ